MDGLSLVLQELKTNRKTRFKDQIDFYVYSQDTLERNPFVQYSLKKSPIDLQTKIIFKEFKNYLNGEETAVVYNEPIFQALRLGRNVLVIENFAEIWYHQDQIFSLSKLL